MGDGNAAAVEEGARAKAPEALSPDFEARQDSLVGKIASQIAAAIVDGTLRPGADLNSVDLAARFGTSRTPVREALMLLEKEGLVEIPPRRRPRVAHITLQEIEEIYEIRAHMNALMIELFVKNAEDSAIGEAREACARMRSAAETGQTAAFFAERARLHDVWAEHCGNATLKRALATWRTRLSLRRLGVDRRDNVERSLLDNERLVLACQERDADLATALIRSMTLRGLQVIRERWFGLDESGSESHSGESVDTIDFRPRPLE